MQRYCSLFLSDDDLATQPLGSSNSFTVEELHWFSERKTDQQAYQQIVFEVFRNPKKLILHIQRIYFTYKHGSTDQLYAALVDLLWVLKGKGAALSKRMFAASRSVLTEKQCLMLEKYFKTSKVELLTGNKYSFFTQGLVGATDLLIEKSAEESAHDPLQIARDFIEYSQLDAAIDILETAVIEEPERHDLQTELLELYKVTMNKQAFALMYQKIKNNSLEIAKGWQQLQDFFAGLSNEK